MTLPRQSILILRKLYHHGKIGEKYINTHNVLRFFRVQDRNKAAFRYWLTELYRRELILIHKGGECISLNKHKLDEIVGIIKPSNNES